MRETSSVWEQVLSFLRSEGITKRLIAEALNLPIAEIESLVFGLNAMQTIDGSGQGSGRGRARLRVFGEEL